ncbi:Homeodomain-like domain-containing protein [Pseudarcicella hirudinis]|uniref:Homeodomain-like domain-containing protein n=1 Tax=Pseudarcicella hirudinis TaxID=1079859 RepID=A0A1I5PB63_9BACT|nr:helix-turn-helix domain-containing protein [Pseudarcicella hirudinis]SFP31213.1 Homeodomain-like domain-containing protein [Pseudarcicella hirudinis]
MSKAKTRKEIADEFGIHPKTLRRWLKKESDIILEEKCLITPKMYQIIKERFIGK